MFIPAPTEANITTSPVITSYSIHYTKLYELFVSNKVPQLQLSAPSIGDFPWGNSGTTTEIVTRPVFQWRNNSLKIMTMMPNGNVGVGTVSPTALFHTNGTLRFQNLLV